MENNTLHVTAEGEENKNGRMQSERYEQIVSLPGPVQNDKMRIERKQNLIVIELPKAKTSTASATPKAAPAMDDLALFDQSIINRMARMQERMEQMFRDSFPNDLTSGFKRLQLGSAVQIDDPKDQYVARFYLPDKDLKKVDVKLEHCELRLTASETEKSQGKGASRMQSGRYEQLVTLPGPVQEKGMKVERQNGTIVVTLPKA